MKTLAITGATGFVGRSLVDYFVARGYRVLAFGRRAQGPRTDVAYRAWDIAHGPLRITEPVDAVIHCAAAVTEWGTFAALYPTNVIGTRHVLASFRDAGQFIQISSASVYDPLGAKHFIREETPYPARYLNAYGQTKMLAERVVRAAPNLNRTILRPHNTYGPGDTTLLPRLLKARRHGRFLVLGNGRNTLSLTYILNLAAALELLVQRPHDRRIFNITDERVATVDEILRAFLQTMGYRERVLHINRTLAHGASACLEGIYRVAHRRTPPLITPYVVAQMTLDFTLDISKARRLLGYCPAYDYLDGFRAIQAVMRGQHTPHRAARSTLRA
jgi:nucleoside-diphosphate-sugar epimerase